MHGAAGEELCGGDGKCGGQLDDGIGAVLDGVPRPFVFMKDCRFAALGEVAAHDTEDFVASGQSARLGELVFMSVVEGVVFANYRTKFHVFFPVSFTS